MWIPGRWSVYIFITFHSVWASFDNDLEKDLILGKIFMNVTTIYEVVIRNANQWAKWEIKETLDIVIISCVKDII